MEFSLQKIARRNGFLSSLSWQNNFPPVAQIFDGEDYGTAAGSLYFISIGRLWVSHTATRGWHSEICPAFVTSNGNYMANPTMAAWHVCKQCLTSHLQSPWDTFLHWGAVFVTKLRLLVGKATSMQLAFILLTIWPCHVCRNVGCLVFFDSHADIDRNTRFCCLCEIL